jgi:hypothetical protein
VFGDDAGSVGRDLGDGKPWVFQSGDFGEEAVVASGGLASAFNDVAGHNCSGQLIPVVAFPFVIPSCRAHDYGGIGDSSSDDDVGTLSQGLGDSPAAEVGVRGNGRAFTQLGPGVEVGKCLTLCAQIIPAGEQIVTGYVGNAWGQAKFGGNVGHGFSAGLRVQAACVGNYLDTFFQAFGHDVFHLGDKGAGVTSNSALAGASQDEHG